MFAGMEYRRGSHTKFKIEYHFDWVTKYRYKNWSNCRGNMNIIGVHDGHNATASFFENGKIKFVLQEERLRHEKNFDGFPEKSIRKMLDLQGLTPSNIDAVVLNGYYQPKPMNRLERIEVYKKLATSRNAIKATFKKFNLLNTVNQKINKTKRISCLTEMGFLRSRIHMVDHHTAHAAATYYGNNEFEDDVLVLTNDGAGDRICATISVGKKGKLERLYQIHEDHSIGLLYAAFTFLTGMVPLEHEYKIMGMAPYADMKGARKVADEFHSMFRVNNNGLTWEFLNGDSVYQSIDYFKEFMFLIRFDHLMAGIQIFIEEFLVNWVKSAIRETGVRKIALSGGTFMNVKANKIIMELDEVEKLYIFPSCGDESNAIGVAYDYFARHADYADIEKLENVYFGVEYSNDAVKKTYDNYKFKHNYRIQYYENIEKKSAEILAMGDVLARFKGREEFGARSLGNRAILGNPLSDDVIKTINKLIKNRDFWMPFASSILDSDIDRYVKMNNKIHPYYMIMTYDTKEEAKEIIGGIHPYDKTVRPNLVTQKHNEFYWKLLHEFKKITGIGGLLNTSLNLHGLPLVYSPEDAFEVIEESKLKYLAIENYLIEKID
ncbi:MAG: hypothetical protein KKC76_21065 [Proteobacteria bacterium]|nr:hypothetical protein [Pseudomonadota bacterium]